MERGKTRTPMVFVLRKHPWGPSLPDAASVQVGVLDAASPGGSHATVDATR